MSFVRILDTEREIAERAWNRYVELLQLVPGDEASEAELREVAKTLKKDLAEMTADRRALEQAKTLQKKIEAGTGVGERQRAAHKALKDYDEETRRLLVERRAGYRKLWLAASDLDELHNGGHLARHELVRLMRKHPRLLGEEPVVV